MPQKGRRDHINKEVCMLEGLEQKSECCFVSDKNLLDITEKI
jgi:hypothetical protein